MVLAYELIPAPGRGLGITMQDVGVEVDAVRPANGAGDLIDDHLSEVRGIVERFEDATAIDNLLEVEISDETIPEGEPQSVIA